MNAMTAISTRKEKGFTLIELVMVIVILGILAAFALPRFADFSGDAESASIDGAKGSVRSAAGIVRAKALAENKGSATTSTSTSNDGVTLEGTEIELTNGYLAATSVEDAAQLDGYAVVGSSSPYIIAIAAEAGKPCFTFADAASGSSPTVSDVQTMADADTCGSTDAGS